MYVPRDLIRIFKHVNDRVESEHLSRAYIRVIYEKIHLFWKISVQINFFFFTPCLSRMKLRLKISKFRNNVPLTKKFLHV